MSTEHANFDLAADDCHRSKIQDDGISTLILTCSEPQSANLDLMPSGIGSVRIVKTEGGFAGLNRCNDRSNHWLAQYIQAFPSLARVIVCAHNNCRFIAESGLSASEDNPLPAERYGLKQLESAVQIEIETLRDLIRGLNLLRKPVVLGCIYEREYDWLAIHDDETNLFLPTNVYSIAVE